MGGVIRGEGPQAKLLSRKVAEMFGFAGSVEFEAAFGGLLAVGSLHHERQIVMIGDTCQVRIQAELDPVIVPLHNVREVKTESALIVDVDLGVGTGIAE